MAKKNRIVSDAEWLRARHRLLAEEKTLQRQRDKLAAERQAMPWRRIDKAYEFVGENGACDLGALFDDRSQLIVYHFMFHPDWEEGCRSCSFWADNFERSAVHLKARDVSLVAVSRAPLEKLLAYRARLGWTFRWYSSGRGDFNHDFGVSFTPEELAAGEASYNYREGAAFLEELPGISVFYKAGCGSIFHTYSTYARGLDPFNATYQLLDIVPKGRDEAPGSAMDWVRRNDEY